jgi:hypothetical protein
MYRVLLVWLSLSGSDAITAEEMQAVRNMPQWSRRVALRWAEDAGLYLPLHEVAIPEDDELWGGAMAVFKGRFRGHPLRFPADPFGPRD